MLYRKIDDFLEKWKSNPYHNPLIVYGARQVGKTTSIGEFGKRSYKSYIEINFVTDPYYKDAFLNEKGEKTYDPEEIVKHLSFMNPSFKFIEHDTLILFDEIQEFMDATTSLKFFKLNGKYDVICSGSQLGVSSGCISSVSVGFKDEYVMHPMAFDEFLIANGYNQSAFDSLLSNMVKKEPLAPAIYSKLEELFWDYLVVGGYPKNVDLFIKQKNYSEILENQKKTLKDYKDDIIKYLKGLDKMKTLRVYESMPAQLGKENHKFQFVKLGHGSRYSSYIGCIEWIKNAGIILTCSNVPNLQLPFKGNEDIDNFRAYFCDHSLLLASLDDETQITFRTTKNLGIYSGAMTENLIAESLIKQGYDLYFYRSVDSTIELDFIINYKGKILPIEVKSKNGKQKSLNSVISNESIEISNGIKFAKANIGEANGVTTFPLFLSFLLKDYLEAIR